ncbi:hypothetical protein [Streptomyces marokkonensis]
MRRFFDGPRHEGLAELAGLEQRRVRIGENMGLGGGTVGYEQW